MMHTIIEEGLTDENYIKDFTEGIEDLKEHVRAFSPKTCLKSAGSMRVRSETIAREYAKADGVSFSGGRVFPSTYTEPIIRDA